jgi:hypothetical protein
MRLDRPSETEVISELETHIEDRLTEMTEAGLSEEEATNVSLRLLGSARMVARQIYEARSQGSWGQALMGALPHLLFAMLFVLNWWQGVGWLAIILGLVLGTALYGWVHGRPIWLFPWLGCTLLPVIVAGLLLMYLPRGWSWLAVVAYVPLALWLICAITVQTIRRDWLYGALMLLPVPVVIGWALAVADGGGFLGLNPDQITASAGRIGLSFVVLAITAVAFIRLRQRWLRVVLLHISGFFSLIMVASYADRGLSFPAFLFLNVIMLALLFTPALIERRLRRKEQDGEEVLVGDRIADARNGRL